MLNIKKLRELRYKRQGLIAKLDICCFKALCLSDTSCCPKISGSASFLQKDPNHLLTGQGDATNYPFLNLLNALMLKSN
jgi:hypothetical protein